MSSARLESVIRYAEDDTSFGIAKAVEDRFVVIDRNDLPKVEADDGENVRIGPGGNWFARGLNAEGLRQQAYRLLVAADWTDANPPVDEDKVRAVRLALARVVGPHSPHSHLDEAARLIVKALTKAAS